MPSVAADPAPRAPTPVDRAALPEVIAARAGELPPETIAWLEEEIPDPERKILDERSRAFEALALVPGAILFWWAIASATAGGTWDRAHELRVTALCLLASLALVLGARRFHAAVASRLPWMKLLHSAYYLEVDHDRLRFFPLVHLHDVAMARRGGRGGSTRTDVMLPFGPRRRRVPFRHMDAASRFVQDVLRRRHLLVAPAGPVLAGVHGIELLPAHLRARGARFDPRPWLLGAAALLAGAASAYAAHAAHARAERAWEAETAPPPLTVSVRWSESSPAAGGVRACAFPAGAQASVLVRALRNAVDAERVRLVPSPDADSAALDVAVTARPAGSYRPAGVPGSPQAEASELSFALILRRPGEPARELRGVVPPPTALLRPGKWPPCDQLRRAQATELAARIAEAIDPAEQEVP